ncbi:MAG: tRNA lysidine(34) synthetase TilS [Spirochaetaceae bacterium]|jgi:tRNA(Ile)-lysidine synthase|nr:tRNA lysidine(34) synthetase TilS [Spirochaetaceae bacterium]
MDSVFVTDFERRVGDELSSFLGFAGKGGGEGKSGSAVVAAAVSGGPDSMALLRALLELRKEYGYLLEVVTVDHNMRSPEESGADAVFVSNFCRDRGVSCTVVVLKPGEIASTAVSRGRGTEDAARFLRYEILERFAAEKGASVVCLGHNRNDQLETLVQRFLQGGSAQGIQKSRGVFFRPLLGISRKDIEQYLALTGTDFRIDGTNSDTGYLRNRLRLKLLPLLDEVYPGWDEGVFRGAEQAEMHNAVVETLVPGDFWSRDGTAVPCETVVSGETGISGEICVSGDRERFLGLPEAVRLRLLQQGLVELQRGSVTAGARIPGGTRVPREMLMRAVRGNRRVAGCGIVITCEGADTSEGNTSGADASTAKIRLFRDIAYTKRIGYFDIVRECGCIRIPCETTVFQGTDVLPGTVRICSVLPEDAQVYQGPFQLPLVIRSRREGDVVADSGGGMRSVKKVLGNWKVPSEIRDSIPIVEDARGIRCVWGSVFGYDDWVVKDSVASEKSGTYVYLVLLGL